MCSIRLALRSDENYALTTTTSDGAKSVACYDNLQRVIPNAQHARRHREAKTYFDAYGRQRCAAREVSGGHVGQNVTCDGKPWTVSLGLPSPALPMTGGSRRRCFRRHVSTFTSTPA